MSLKSLMGRMKDEDVSRLLRELPCDEPSFDFTQRVLKTLDARVRGPRRRSRAFSLALVAAAVGGIFLGQGYVRERYQRSRAAARVRELRDEYRELQGELEKLRVLSRELEPVLDLGGTEDVGFVFDLRELARREAEVFRADPASHAPSETSFEPFKPLKEERRP
jgi:hypothetical protein